MGVYATFCEVCGLPVQRDHYVTPNGEPLESYQGMVRIWRAGDAERPAVQFEPSHAWLDDAVALTGDPDEGAPLEGEVGDGHLEDAEGETHNVDGYPVLHRACWEKLGSPKEWSPRGELPKNEALEAFQRQLFDFAGLVAAGAGNWLEDPRGSGPSGAWVDSQADIYFGRKPSPVVHPPSLEQIVQAAHAQKADIVILVPDVAPVFRQQKKELPHAFEAWPHEHWRREVFARLTQSAMNEVFSTGDGVVSFEVAGVGPVKMYVHSVTPESECRARLLWGKR